MLSKYDDDVLLYDYVENIEGNIDTGDVPGTSAQTSTGTANPSPVKRRRKRGVTHYTQKKRRTVPLTMPHQGQLVFFGQISNCQTSFSIYIVFKPCFLQIDNVFISGSSMQW